MSDNKNTRETLLTLGYVIFGLAGSFAAGLLTFSTKFFHLPRPMAPYIIVGLAGALIYASVRMRGAGYAVLMVVLMYFAQLALVGPLRGAAIAGRLTAAAIYALPVGVALLISAYMYKGLPNLRFGKFVVMAVIVAIGYLVMLALWLARSKMPMQSGVLVAQAVMGLKVGAGIGLGLELVDLFATPPRPRDEIDFSRPPV
jgi:hypothetical protein